MPRWRNQRVRVCVCVCAVRAGHQKPNGEKSSFDEALHVTWRDPDYLGFLFPLPHLVPIVCWRQRYDPPPTVTWFKALAPTRRRSKIAWEKKEELARSGNEKRRWWPGSVTRGQRWVMDGGRPGIPPLVPFSTSFLELVGRLWKVWLVIDSSINRN